MKFDLNHLPRIYTTGKDNLVKIADCGQILLEPNEQVTFVTENGKKHDFTAKSWGYYATPSINGRLRDQGFKTAMVKNTYGKFYIMVVDKEKLENFETYLEEEASTIIEWLDER